MVMIAEQTRPMTFEEYLKTPETNTYHELHFGYVVRDEPDARWHQAELAWLQHLIFTHVRERDLGIALPAVTGVVLDQARVLVLEPDILVLLQDRLHLMRDGKVWGAPNLVVEVASPSTRRRDREKKVPWYRTYGGQECWLVDTRAREVEVFNLEAQPTETSQIFRGDEPFHSRVLPDFVHPTSNLFDRYLQELDGRRGARDGA